MRAGMAHRLRPVHESLMEAKSLTTSRMESVPMTFRGVDNEPIENPNYERDIARYREQLNKINLSIAQIEATYPELASFHRYVESHPTGGGQDFRVRTIVALRSVEQDIDRTRNRLITGELPILDVNSVVALLLRQYNGTNPNLRVAVEILRSHRASTDLWRDLGISGISIALLFVPGIGPFLNAGSFLSSGLGLVAGTVQAISNWQQAEAFTDAANTAAGTGIVTTAEAEERRTDAIWDSIFALGDAADFGLEIGEIISVIQATARAARRGTEATGELAASMGGSARRSSSDVEETVPGRRPNVDETGHSQREADITNDVHPAEELLDRRLSIDEAVDEVNIRLEANSADFSADFENSIIEIPVHASDGELHTWQLMQDCSWCRHSEPVCYINQRITRAIEAQISPNRLASRFIERYGGRLRGPETREALRGLCRRVLNGGDRALYSISELRTIHRYLTEEANVEYVEILLPRGRRGERTPDLAVHYTQHRPWASDAHSDRLIDRIEVRTVAPSRFLNQESFVNEVARGIRDKITHRQLGSEIRGARRIPPEAGRFQSRG